MCGIAGIWNSRIAQPLDRVQAMLDAMQHRGPDGRGVLEYAGGAAGMVRLALVDLSDRGQQPLWSLDGKVAILFNGEMYNFREERDRLSRGDFRFRTTTDTEVILNLYLERGLDFVQCIRGMYGIAIFDWRQSAPGTPPTLVLVRGPLGIKPLYVAAPVADPSSVLFASEVRGILASNLVPRSINPEGLVEYLSGGFVLQPTTMINNVRMMDAGTYEVYSPGTPMRSERFWHMPPSDPRDETLDEAAERLRSVLEESVALHAFADAPVGAFLSGGIDSTGIVGLMREHVPNLHTYTLRYADVPGQDEADEATAAAEVYGCRHSIVDVTAQEVAPLLPRYAGELDQPSADGLNTWLISRAAAQDVKGVLSGMGGDEWFAGYPVTRRMARSKNTLAGRLEALTGRLAHPLAAWMPRGRLRERTENLATRRTMLAIWLQGHTVFRYDLARRMSGLTRSTPQEKLIGNVLEQVSADWEQESPVGLSCLLDTRVYLISQLLRDSDATSMAHSLELRVPFVDSKIVEFARSCHDRYKLAEDGGFSSVYEKSGAKRILIHALRNVLPPSIGARRKKGFALPIQTWLRTGLATLLEDTCSLKNVAKRGLVDPDLVAPIWRAARAGRPGYLFPKLWTLMILELWCRAVIDSPDISATGSTPVGSAHAIGTSR